MIVILQLNKEMRNPFNYSLYGCRHQFDLSRQKQVLSNSVFSEEPG